MGSEGARGMRSEGARGGGSGWGRFCVRRGGARYRGGGGSSSFLQQMKVYTQTSENNTISF